MRVFRQPENKVSATKTKPLSSEPASKKKLGNGPTRIMENGTATAIRNKPSQSGSVSRVNKVSR